jgi:hypothetical protein
VSSLPKGKGKSPKKFTFTFSSYAEVLGLSEEAVRKHSQRGNFDPGDLLSVLEFIGKKLKPENKLTEEKSKKKNK